MPRIKMSKKVAKQLLMVETVLINKDGKQVGIEYDGSVYYPIGTFRHAVSIAEDNDGRLGTIFGTILQAEARRVLEGGKK